MENVLLLVVGIVLSVIGIVNISGNISTVHSYNRRNVREEDIPKYGKAVGTGTLVIGASLIAAYALMFFCEGAASCVVVIALAIGLVVILYGQIKYNHGIF